MNSSGIKELAYFPGCSLVTSAKESNHALIEVSRHMGYDLVELDDWNCCGSSSAHSVDSKLAFSLASRNLSLVPEGIPLLVACPGCILNLRQAQLRLTSDPEAAEDYAARWNRQVDQNLQIVHFFELMDGRSPCADPSALNGLRFAPYYGCMLTRPPRLRHEKNYHGLMEQLLEAYGAEPVSWSFSSRCCGTFLSVARPEVVEPMVNMIVKNAITSGAECLVTACAMCHLNLEIRCTLNRKIPIFHFSEILAMAFKIRPRGDWYSRHLVDPLPLLRSRGLMD